MPPSSMPSTLDLPHRTHRSKRGHDDMLSSGLDDKPKAFRNSNDESQIITQPNQEQAADGLSVLVRRRFIRSVQRQPRHRFQIAAASYEAEELHDENDAWYCDEVEDIEADLEALRNQIRSIKRRRKEVEARYVQQRELIYDEKSAVQEIINRGDRETKREFVQQAFRPHIDVEADDSVVGDETVYELGGLGAMGVAEDYRYPEHSHFVPPTQNSTLALPTASANVFPRLYAIAEAAQPAESIISKSTRKSAISEIILHQQLPLRPVADQ